jgi:hypothetical protein
MINGANICYYTDGNGFWLRRAWKPQCSTRVFIYGRCQGVRGHRGAHWCYSPSGSFDWQDNDDDPKHDGCAGSTPPGHKTYVSPLKMQKHYFVSHYSDTEVTDKATIAMLEKGKTPERGASIDRPVVMRKKRKRVAKRRAQELTTSDKSRR